MHFGTAFFMLHIPQFTLQIVTMIEQILNPANVLCDCHLSMAFEINLRKYNTIRSAL